MDLFEEIRGIVCEQLNVRPEKVKPETTFAKDLGADSVDIVELVIALEENFNIELPDEDVKKLQTINDVIKYIKNRTEVA